MDVVNESTSTMEPPAILRQSSENEVQQTQATTTTTKPKPKRKPKRVTSQVWDHFVKVVVDGEVKAKCKHCDKLMSGASKNGTSHLIDHLGVRCSKTIKKIDIRQKLLSVSRRVDGIASIENCNFSQESSRKELVNMVIVHEYPLSMVDHLGFRRFVLSLNPNFKIMSRNTLKYDIMKLFSSEKASLKKLLENIKSKIAITTDMWTATNQRRGYMVVTAHYIDQSWQLRNKILRFTYVPCPHTKDTLAQVLLGTLNGYNIAEKISSIVVDNCSTNDAMLDILRLRLGEESLILEGRFLHMRCTAHILNLIVQDGLDVIGGEIKKVRDCVSFWVATPKRIELFEDKVKSLKSEEARKLPLGCKTRWNSTFLMLQAVLPYKDVFVNIKRQNPRLKFAITSQDEWELAAVVCDKLKVFHSFTELFSGRKYPTSNLFFRQVCEIKLELTSWLQSDTQIIVDMAKRMVQKYEKYWVTINEVLAIAAILDPRNKLECVEFYFSEIYGDVASVEILRVKSTLYDLLNEYENKGLSAEEQYSTSTQDGSYGGVGGDKWNKVKRTKRRKINVKSELDYYLEEDALPESESFDILNYWKNELKFPTLQRIAKDILAIPASSVASESAFSMGGRVIGPHRSKLATNTVEALVCMQNWILEDFFSAGTSLDSVEACATFLEDQDTMDHDSVGNIAESQIVDLDSEDEAVDDCFD